MKRKGVKRKGANREEEEGMNYKEWEKAVPEAIKADSLWKMKA